jgi:hypothetical protein
MRCCTAPTTQPLVVDVRHAEIRIKSIERLQSYCSRTWTFFTVKGAAALTETETDELEQVMETHVYIQHVPEASVESSLSRYFKDCISIHSPHERVYNTH